MLSTTSNMNRIVTMLMGFIFCLVIFVCLARAQEKGKHLLTIHDTELIVPIEGYTVEKLFERSILYYPKNPVKDGLPHFGAVRDDWKNAPRPHKGIDIYVESGVKVIAVANGKVRKTGDGHRAGPFAIINHGNGITVSYIHLSTVKIVPGQKVKKGDVIGTITGPAGNGYEPQLHFELFNKRIRVDPIKLVLKTHTGTEMGDRLEKLYKHFEIELPGRIEKRKLALEQMKKKKD